ncbi:methyltransferase domain-containing protein [Streptomonospora sp. S1-112]|uniref:Methyltransferase domain-containing protein n=1 Tax=Streptomonospora mangrovi TaxID=2883123 RepID=A0A9X3NKQ9_9ACTN|nr:class I SAM-dependent methyltransferase [Streptomonospora mangrovi]MDA0564790.1 methyltransferase domain-containing protein [Streptomonospora mangrovi]
MTTNADSHNLHDIPNVHNVHQFEAWNGYEGRHWADNRERYDAMVGGLNRPLFRAAAIAPGDRVLDVGCGTGWTTRRAALAAPRGSALGVDLSGPMLERARAVAAEKGIANAAFEQGDAQVHPFTPEGFDTAISRGGMWYFSDPLAACANIAAALRPGGRLAFVTPDAEAADPGGDFPDVFGLMGEYLPERPTFSVEDGRSGAAAMSRAADVRRVLGGAGFASVEVEPLRYTTLLGRTAEDATDFLFAFGPVRHWFGDTDPEAEERARAAVRAALEPCAGPGGVRQPGAMLLVTALRV